MRNARNRTAGTRRARCTRWLGLDRNPLRRRSDRIEVVLRLAFLILLAAAVPLVTIMTGRAVGHLAIREARAARASDQLVTAVLTEAAPKAGQDPYSSVQTTSVPARWTAPDGSPRSGMVLASYGAAKGSTVQTWIDRSGEATSPPPTQTDIDGDVSIAVALTAMVLTVTLLGAHVLARHALDRRRFSAWDAEWRSIGPYWTGHRS